MKRLLILLFVLPLFVVGQEDYIPNKAELTKAYSQVISEFIKSQEENKSLNFDTLYIGKHEDFPDIQLPNTILNKRIILLITVKAKKGPEINSAFVLINIIESKLTGDQADFMLVTFYKGYHPQHNCYISLKYNPTTKEFELAKKVSYEYAYPKNK